MNEIAMISQMKYNAVEQDSFISAYFQMDVTDRLTEKLYSTYARLFKAIMSISRNWFSE